MKKQQPDDSVRRKENNTEEHAVNTKGVLGLLSTTFANMFAFAFVLIALPVMVKEVIGESELADVFGLGTAFAVLLSYVAGKMIDTFTLLKVMLINTWARAILLGLHFAFYHLNLLNFWSLSILVMLDLFLLTSVVALNGALIPFLVGGSSRRNTTMNAINWLMFAGVQVFVGLVLSGGQMVDDWGWWNIYGLAALVNLATLPVVYKTIPDIFTDESKNGQYQLQQDQSQGNPQSNWQRVYEGLSAVNRRSFMLWGSAFAAGLAMYQWSQSTMPLVCILLVWIALTPGATIIRSHRTLWLSASFIVLSGIIIYPLRNIYIPLIASSSIPGDGDIGLLVGQLSAGLFLGMMLAAVIVVQLPRPLAGLLKLGFGLSMAGMLYFLIFPGELVPLLLGMAFYIAVVIAARWVNEKVWLLANLLGLPLMWLMTPFWGNLSMIIMLLSLIGFLHNSTPAIFYGKFYGSAYSNDAIRPNMGAVSATLGALLNLGLAFGYGLADKLAPQPESFPAAFSSIAVMFTLAAILFALSLVVMKKPQSQTLQPS